MSPVARTCHSLVTHHCDSCHEDNDNYSFDLVEYELPDGTTVHVCCTVLHLLEAL